MACALTCVPAATCSLNRAQLARRPPPRSSCRHSDQARAAPHVAAAGAPFDSSVSDSAASCVTLSISTFVMRAAAARLLLPA